MTATENRFFGNPPLRLSVTIALGMSALIFGALNLVYLAHPRFDFYHPVLTQVGNGRTVDLTSDLTHCPVHGKPLAVVEVWIGYGLFAGPFPSSVDEKTFPFGRTGIRGGCCYEWDSPSSAKISQCPECVAARRAWMAIHARRSNFGTSPKPVKSGPIDLGGFAIPIEPTLDLSPMKELLDPLAEPRTAF